MKISSALLRSLVVVAAAAPLRAQVQQDWSRTYSTAGNDSAYVTAIDAAGNVYAAGIANTNSSFQDGSAFVAAWDASGNSLWSTTFDSTLGHGERPSAIEFDGAGGLYVAGVAVGGSAGNSFAGFLLRIDSAGVITWSVQQPTVTLGSRPFPFPMILDAQGQPVIGVRSPSGDFQITAYTPVGGQAWQTTHAGTAGGVDTIVSLALAPSGEIVAVGDANSPSMTTPGNPTLLRLAPGGGLLQALEIVTPEMPTGLAVDVEVDAQGRIFIAATATPGGWLSIHSLALLSFDAQGALGWVRTITGPGQGPFNLGGAKARDLEIDVFGRAIVMGGRAQGAHFGTATLIAAYDVNGNEAWRNIVSDALDAGAIDIFNPTSELLLDPSGEILSVGTYAAAPKIPTLTEADACVLALDAGGQKRFGFAYGFPPQSDGSRDSAGHGAVGAGQTFVIGGSAQTAAGTVGNDAFVAHYTRTASGFGFGDGSAAACPCGNLSQPVERAGCTSSLGTGGRLADLGASSLANDSLSLVGTSMPNAVTVYYQGTHAAAGVAFGDGILVVRGSIVRLGDAFNVGGTSQFPGIGGSPISVAGQVAGPGERFYQAVYRNGAPFCAPGKFNTTNGLKVLWGP